MPGWITEHGVEIFGAVTGIVYVFLEIRQNILLWPLGIITSAVYIYVFRENGFYAGMVLQIYYLGISIYGWWAWKHGERALKNDPVDHFSEQTDSGAGALKNDPPAGGHFSEQTYSGEARTARHARVTEQKSELVVRRLDLRTGAVCLAVSLALWGGLWYLLDTRTDSPVPVWDGLITSLSVVATWMLTRKILEQWHVWIFANSIAVFVYLAVNMYPTAVLFLVYTVMAVAGLRVWRRGRTI